MDIYRTPSEGEKKNFIDIRSAKLQRTENIKTDGRKQIDTAYTKCVEGKRKPYPRKHAMDLLNKRVEEIKAQIKYAKINDINTVNVELNIDFDALGEDTKQWKKTGETPCYLTDSVGGMKRRTLMTYDIDFKHKISGEGFTMNMDVEEYEVLYGAKKNDKGKKDSV